MTRRPTSDQQAAPVDLDARRALRDQAVDAREAAADVHDALNLQRDLDIEELLAGAQERDDAAAQRDVSAEGRDEAAAGREIGRTDAAAVADRRDRARAKGDRSDSGRDRLASASDRDELSEPGLRAAGWLAFAAAPIGMGLMAPDGRWLKVNRALCRLTGRDEASLLSSTSWDITHPDDRTADEQVRTEALSGDRTHDQWEARYVLPDGRQVWVSVDVSLVASVDSSPDFFIVQVQDIQDRHEAEERLQHQAAHDELTGLWNRARLHEELERCLSDASRHHEPAVLLVIDLDGFKAVNDTLGHGVGDERLGAAAAAIAGVVRTVDSCARLGGDEFAVVLPRTTSVEALAVSARVVAAVAELPGEPGLHASVGMAVLQETFTPQAWLHRADQAMYTAKRAGGDRTVVLET